MNNILSVEISCFRDYHTPDNPKTILLDKWLKSTKYQKDVDMIRRTQEKMIRDSLKSKLPAITPSGTFTQRGEQYLIKHSGYLQFDIDQKDNKDIDLNKLKVDIMKLKCIAYCGLSVSGLGLWGLVRIAHPDKHKDHFFALDQVFKSLGITIDQACKDVSRLRGYSYDPEGQFNYKVIEFIHTAPRIKPQTSRIFVDLKDNYHKVQHCIDQLNGVDITAGYENWFALGCSLASEFSKMGRKFYHDISRFHPEYDPMKTDKQYDCCLTGSGYSIGTFFELCKQHGIYFIDEKKDKSKDSDIFCQMAKKNPALLTLRDKFDLISGNDQKELICN